MTSPVMSRISAALIAATGWFPPVTGAAAPAAGSVDAAGWVRELGGEPFARTAQAESLSAAIDSARASARASLGTSPFTVELQVDGEGFQRVEDETDPARVLRKELDGLGSGRVRYQPRLGLDVSLSGSGGYDRYQVPDGLPRQPDFPYGVSLDISYDLLRGGPQGLEESRAAAASRQAVARFYDAHQQLLDARIRYARQLVDLFVINCKITELGKARAEVAKAGAEGKLKVDTKVISYKDYLNVLELQNSFARRSAALEVGRTALVQQLNAWSPAVGAQANALGARPLECPADLGAVHQRARGVAPADRAALARALPSYGSAAASQAAAELLLRVTELSQRTALFPFVSGDFARTPQGRVPLAQVQVGLQGSWRIPGQREADEREAARLATRAAAGAVTATEAFNRSALEALAADLEAQERLWEVLKKSLQNSGELLRTLEAQRAIGLVDSLSYTSAFLNSIDARFAILDSLAAQEKAIDELSLYNAWANSAPTPIP